MLAAGKPIQTGIPEPIALDSRPSEAAHSYVITAVDAAGNTSAPSETVYLNFGLLPVNNLHLTLNEGGLPQLQWQYGSSGITGYHLYRGVPENPIRINTGLIVHNGTTTRFVDKTYNAGEGSDGATQARTYTVVAVDSHKVESIGHSITLPALSVSADATEHREALKRGVINRVYFTVINRGERTASGVRLYVSVNDKGTAREHHSSPFRVEAGGSTRVPVVIGGYRKLDSYTTLQLRLEQQPQPGETVTLRQSEEVQAGDLAVMIEEISISRMLKMHFLRLIR
ncbi:hypothetical protein [Candidatus Vondammii sp. HM_W22]|uniref:hypothetical protein n=1 Tax=Candidatus Vondammii sp. HM_W22 TaxID=2687299 RepID=UPI001F12CE4A|nr:hypothetical protein [Candidatus Vondammii sp. HM_W22]